ncbi:MULTISPECIES: ABC transporter ATP-binding protein [unclassified Viridibacillus]|uniref:ABC transporter ATP-binding protein n=1 Tax=unclassified Viridibacillus TaxID=2617942 RepID=UPI00096E7283|nr:MULTISPECIES: ABC transporter ATP-binding protein [unclassified Viridibacillus]OMC78482.1 ABC transporter ATP-binding protein [Viridibacillus sp. FSL H8-0123]OMC82758.1 ABC transporter ATP-binding protein [Viridibacillus sp. FSL H7-0596]
MDYILQVKNLHVSFDTYAGEVQAVRGVSFDLKAGETLAIVGESGSGKSVTSKSLVRLNPPESTRVKNGEILFEGKNILNITEQEMRKIRGADIAMIFQDPMTALNPTMTIGKQIAESIRKHTNMGSTKVKDRVIELLQMVGIKDAETRIKQYPHQFSGGMRQRIVIAMALACEPKIIIADEPTTALDVSIQAQILELLKHIQQQMGLSIVFITHDLGVVAKMADRVAVMYAGKIVEIGLVDEVFYKTTHPYTKGLLAAMPRPNMMSDELYSIPGSPPDLLNLPQGDAFAERNKQALKIDFIEEPPLFQISDTHFAATWLLHELAPKTVPLENKSEESMSSDFVLEQERTTKENLILVKGLKQYFKLDKHNTVKAVDDISFNIYKGEIFGLVGESGCGKSTTGRSLIKLNDMTAGEVIIDGKDIRKVKSKKELLEFNRKVQMIFQDPYSSLNPRMKVADIIAEGLDIHHLNVNQRQEKVHDLLETVGLNKEHANRYPHEFSGGQRQRIGIARALAVEPDFIIADEPISALDVSIQAQIVNLLKKLQKEKGLTYLFIAHDLSMVKYISDRIGVMYRGKIVEMASSEELYENPIHPYTKSLLSALPLPDPLLERERKRIIFDDQSYEGRNRENEILREVRKGHFVMCTEQEYEEYRKTIKVVNH